MVLCCEDAAPGCDAVPPRLPLAHAHGRSLTAVTGLPVRFYWGSPLWVRLFFRRLTGDGRVDACGAIVPGVGKPKDPACNLITPGLRPGGMNAISEATGPPAGVSRRAEPSFSVVRTGLSPEEQFRQFAVESTAALHRIAYLLCGDDHRAHDLTQIALERTYRHWSRIKDGNPFGYARKVLATARIDGWRRSRREVLRSPEDVAVVQEAGRAGQVPADDAAQVAERERLVRALRQLGPGQRRVVVLRHLLDRSEADVAEELGVSVGNVKSQGARGLARLRTLLSEGAEV